MTPYHIKLKYVFANNSLLTVRTYRYYGNLRTSQLLELRNVCLGICGQLIVRLDACDVLAPAIHLDVLSLHALKVGDGLRNIVNSLAIELVACADANLLQS